MEATKSLLAPRQHIQDHDAAESVIHHWGYADRVVPCVNDPGSCRYLDVVYNAHDVGMIYTGVIWATIGGILLIWAIVRRTMPPQSHRNPQALVEGEKRTVDTTTRIRHTLWSYTNRYLLPDSIRSIFGRTTRLQVLVLAILTGYLTIFSFAGIVYGIWITPVKNMEGVYNTRSSLGPFSDRVGVIAYALTPLSVLLSNRESLLSVLTGIPYQNFNFMHRWLGYIIMVQSIVHTIGWTIIEVKLYQPQPQVAKKWIMQLYMIWGVVAMVLLLILYALTLPPVIRFTGYEFFRKSHYVLALVYMGACIGHWEGLQCFIIPGILLWFIDRFARAARTFLLHYNFVDGTKRGFVAAHAAITTFPDEKDGDVPSLSTGAPNTRTFSAPRAAETKKIAQIAAKKLAAAAAAATAPATTSEDKNGVMTAASAPTTPVVLTGPYGDPIMRNITPEANILCVAGGTGITYVLPALLSLTANPASPRKLELIWVVRHAKDVDWVKPELAALEALDVTVRIFATRDAASSSSDADRSSEAEADEEKRAAGAVAVQKMRARGAAASVRSGGIGHPDLALLVREFVQATVAARTVVFASGPGGLMTDARAAVAACNDGGKVWKGDERFNVDLIHDERMER
ncbi:conserved hypothetical protein [Verticillium alfalfae VaMs.102]|uniref:Uncharacterized protein n=1 Tax=Verticillium alfalfae (strain VaMs.102 / ATCC MYA-4576 / FGSC 10136) TaxID=526221 RepID=C9SQ28_VERA1|nr:conserved hypothetical protein [Verticillium alfalfae VaMs.102]EEY20953.1 conserved hypothetical protein [Verticillium alfalfae VaMs.102]